jgi:hypothetical protein
MSMQPHRPSRSWYVVAAAALVGALGWVAAGAVLGSRAVDRQVDGFQRVALPGETVVTFSRPGGYVLYLESPISNATIESNPTFTASLVPVSGGQEVPMRDYGNAIGYRANGYDGWPARTFQIDTPGRYVLSGDAGVERGRPNLAVGGTTGATMLRSAVLTAIGAVALVVGGVALAVVVALRRRRVLRVTAAPVVVTAG